MVRSDEQITLHEAAERLGVHYMTAYRYVRTGRLPATREQGQWRIATSDLARVPDRAPPGRAPGRTRRAGRAGELARRMQDRLLAGDEAGAWAILESAMAAGTTPDALVLDILCPALEALGRGWERGALSVADEHRASAVARRLAGRLGPRFARRGRRRGTVILAAPAGEQHDLAVALVADLLRWAGFEVAEYGADTPATALAETAAATQGLVAVGLVAQSSASLDGLAESVAELRRVAGGVPVFAGGAGLPEERALALGADYGTGADGRSVLALAEELANGSAPSSAGSSRA